MIRWAWRIAAGGFLVFVLTAAGVVTAHFLLRDDAQAAAAPPTVRVVLALGAGMRQGGHITHSSRTRIERAVALARGSGDVWLVASGGTGYPATPARPSELMRDWAIAGGFPAERIVVENRSRTTLENLALSLPIARTLGAEPGNGSLVIVTDTTHVPRTLVLARVMGWGGLTIVPSNSFDAYRLRGKIRTVLRETLAIWWNLGKLAAWKALGMAGLSPGERLEYVY